MELCGTMLSIFRSFCYPHFFPIYIWLSIQVVIFYGTSGCSTRWRRCQDRFSGSKECSWVYKNCSCFLRIKGLISSGVNLSCAALLAFPIMSTYYIYEVVHLLLPLVLTTFFTFHHVECQIWPNSVDHWKWRDFRGNYRSDFTTSKASISFRGRSSVLIYSLSK